MDNLEVNTERLRIVALTPHELQLLIENIPQLETELGVSYKGVQIVDSMLDVTKSQFFIALTDEKNYAWHTFWQFILKEENVIIGSACFKGLPDKDGNVEIGYGINEIYEHKGYTTEAVVALCEWVHEQDAKFNVIAETEKDNIQSHSILKKCGMEIYKETEDTFWWKKKKE